jgi:hypothetical protein
VLFIAFSVLVYTFYRIFDCSFNKTRNADFCSDLNFCRCYLSIIIMFLDFSTLLNLVVYAFIWRIIIQAIQRILASVKSMIANFYAFFLVLLSLFVLKATTSHIFIKSFVCFNTLSHLNYLAFCIFDWHIQCNRNISDKLVRNIDTCLHAYRILYLCNASNIRTLLFHRLCQNFQQISHTTM